MSVSHNISVFCTITPCTVCCLSHEDTYTVLIVSPYSVTHMILIRLLQISGYFKRNQYFSYHYTIHITGLLIIKNQVI